MSESHADFWGEWSRAYQGFSETVEPYREAQRMLAEGIAAALQENLERPSLLILDVGGGAGNLIRPLLEAVERRRGSLARVRYTLTDGSREMAGLASQRLAELEERFPAVAFSVAHLDTLGEEFLARLGPGQADAVVCSWNIEYYPMDLRLAILRRLCLLAHDRGVVAFSSSVRLPGDLTMRDLLMPFGQAQVLQALLTDGPGEMRRVIASLKQIAAFGQAMSSHSWPEKPLLADLHGLAEQAGLQAASSGYHLFGASGMVVARKDGQAPPALPSAPIARPLAGQAGYEAHTATLSFWSYLRFLLRSKIPE